MGGDDSRKVVLGRCDIRSARAFGRCEERIEFSRKVPGIGLICVARVRCRTNIRRSERAVKLFLPFAEPVVFKKVMLVELIDEFSDLIGEQQITETAGIRCLNV